MAQALSPTFLTRVDHNIQRIAADTYLRIGSRIWWDQVCRLRPSGSLVEQVVWMLGTAEIEVLDEGQTVYQDLVEVTHKAENKFSGVSLEIFKSELTDIDGKGPGRASEWAKYVGAKMALWPQKLLAEAIKGGESTTKSFDGLSYFNAAHPCNPYSGTATYSNLLTGGNAKPIGGSTDIDVAHKNFGEAVAHAETIVGSDGVTPRNLQVKGVVVPPQLRVRAELLTQARFLPGGSGGTADMLPTGFSQIAVHVAPELSSDASSYYLVTTGADDELSAFCYWEREPFSISSYSDTSDAEIKRTKKFEWHCEGRNCLMSGLPYGLIKVKAS